MVNKTYVAGPMTVTLTLPTIEQARAVKDALDLYMRMGLGQFDELAHMVRCDELKHRTKDLTADEMDEFAALTQRLKDFMGHEYGASLGVGSKRVSITAHRCYEVYKVLSKALADALDPSPTGFKGVDHDGLIVRYTSDPAPVARVK